MLNSSAIQISRVSHSYGSRRALQEVDFEVVAGEIFAIVGPNGGGKTTLFRLLSTLMPLSEGQVTVLGHDLSSQFAEIRGLIGVVFQAPSVDKKLTVAENLHHQGHLYGLSGTELAAREDDLLERFGIADRRKDFVEKLSGGLRRRVELAKSMLHQPRLLLLDEPSTGLDPAARSDIWQHFEKLASDDGVTVVLTTHLLEEADKADRVAILDRGSVVALDTPDALRSTVGGDAITIRTENPETLAAAIRDQLGCDSTVVDGNVRLEAQDGHQWVTRIVEAFPGKIESITMARPTLEDVFIDRTGHRFHEDRETSELEEVRLG